MIPTKREVMSNQLTPAAQALLARVEAKNYKPEPDMERVKRAVQSLTPPPPKRKPASDSAIRHYMKPGTHSKCSGFSQPNFFQ